MSTTSEPPLDGTPSDHAATADGSSAGSGSAEVAEPLAERFALYASLLDAVLASTSDGVLIVDEQDRVVSYNRRFVELWAIPDAVLAERCADQALAFVADQLDDPEGFVERVRALYTDQDGDPDWPESDTLRRRDGRLIERRCWPQEVHGRALGLVWTFRDVTEQARTAAALVASERRYRSLIENALDFITILAADGTITFQSPSVERVLGYAPEELVGRSVFELIHPDEVGRARQVFVRLDDGSGASAPVEVRFLHHDGSWRILEAVVKDLLGDPVIGGLLVNAKDVTERRRAEERLLHDAFHDRLTELPNRALFMDRLAQLVKRGRRPEPPGYTVLFLDVDRFKAVNDSLGHSAGDQLLMGLGARLERCVRPGDTVARVGGDEFALLIDGMATPSAAERLADRIHAAMERPFPIAGREVHASVSIGVALGKQHYDKAEDVLRDADIAMYRSKKLARAQTTVFDSTMREQAIADLELETSLRLAVERQEFVLHFQPIISLRDGWPVGFEALLRWRHPVRGLLAPDAFLVMAEDTGLLVPIGWWTLEEAARRAREWWRPELGRPYVAVNLSATQLAQPDLVRQVRGVLARSGAPPESLRLELTESVVMDQAEETARTLERLRTLGVSLLIDDFGTGYSSLGYLHRFAAQALKIDDAFTARVGPNGEDSEIVRTIVALADELEMEVVAEGVETADQLRIMRILGCTSAQGYHFSRAVDEAEAGTLVERVWEIH